MVAPVLGDGDEPLGTGVLGDIGGSGITMSGAAVATAVCHGQLRSAFRGADGDKHKRPRERRRSEIRAYNREQDRLAALARKKQADKVAAEIAARKAQEAARAARVQELGDFIERVRPVTQARLARDDADMEALLLLDAA